MMQRKQRKSKNKKSNKIKVRKTWGTTNPVTSVHSTEKGKRGYSRKENHRIERESY